MLLFVLLVASIVLSAVQGFQNENILHLVTRLTRPVHNSPIVPFATRRPESVKDDDDSSHTMEQQQEEMIQRGELVGTMENLLWVLPWVSALLAYESYEDIARLFHNYLISVNSYKWGPGEEYGSSIIANVLNGPLSGSLSIMFGTLVAVTVSTLYDRQQTIERAIIDFSEEARILKSLLQGFPDDDIRSLLEERLAKSTSILFDKLRTRDMSIDNLRRQKELPTMMKILTKLSKEESELPRMFDECVGSVRSMLSARATLLSSLQSSFPPWHYITLASLAAAQSLVFLFDANGNDQLYQAGFQLQLCWGALFWVWSMLGVLIYDLSSPLSGFFKVSQNRHLYFMVP